MIFRTLGVVILFCIYSSQGMSSTPISTLAPPTSIPSLSKTTTESTSSSTIQMKVIQKAGDRLFTGSASLPFYYLCTKPDTQEQFENIDNNSVRAKIEQAQSLQSLYEAVKDLKKHFVIVKPLNDKYLIIQKGNIYANTMHENKSISGVTSWINLNKDNGVYGGHIKRHPENTVILGTRDLLTKLALTKTPNLEKFLRKYSNIHNSQFNIRQEADQPFIDDTQFELLQDILGENTIVKEKKNKFVSFKIPWIKFWKTYYEKSSAYLTKNTNKEEAVSSLTTLLKNHLGDNTNLKIDTHANYKNEGLVSIQEQNLQVNVAQKSSTQMKIANLMTPLPEMQHIQSKDSSTHSLFISSKNIDQGQLKQDLTDAQDNLDPIKNAISNFLKEQTDLSILVLKKQSDGSYWVYRHGYDLFASILKPNGSVSYRPIQQAPETQEEVIANKDFARIFIGPKQVVLNATLSDPNVQHAWEQVDIKTATKELFDIAVPKAKSQTEDIWLSNTKLSEQSQKVLNQNGFIFKTGNNPNYIHFSHTKQSLLDKLTKPKPDEALLFNKIIKIINNPSKTKTQPLQHNPGITGIEFTKKFVPAQIVIQTNTTPYTLIAHTQLQSEGYDSLKNAFQGRNNVTILINNQEVNNEYDYKKYLREAKMSETTTTLQVTIRQPTSSTLDPSEWKDTITSA